MKISHFFSTQNSLTIAPSGTKAHGAISNFFRNMMGVKNSNVEKTQQQTFSEPKASRRCLSRTEGAGLAVEVKRVLDANAKAERIEKEYSTKALSRATGKHVLAGMENRKRVTFDDRINK